MKTLNQTTDIITHNAPQAHLSTFKAGDRVLCPLLGNDVYMLEDSDNGTLRIGGLTVQTDGRIDPKAPLPSVFHASEANHDAIAQLYDISKPFYPNYWERQHGYMKNGIFHCPHFHLIRNCEYLDVNGVTHAYKYIEGYQILMHLQQVSDDVFELVPFVWQPMPNAVLISDKEVTA